MSTLPWRDALAQELAAGGLPAGYVARLLDELDDHAWDLQEEERQRMSTDATSRVTGGDPRAEARRRMGSPEELAQSALVEYRRSTFCGRHPVWGFVVAPTLALAVCWVAGISGFASLAANYPDFRQLPLARIERDWQVAKLVHAAVLLLPPLAVVAVGHWLWRRSGRPVRWVWIMTGIVALLAGMSASQLQFPMVDSRGTLTFGLGLALVPRPEQWAQAALPILAGFVCFRWFAQGKATAEPRWAKSSG